MLMPVTQSIMVLAIDDRIWLDADTLISYFRDIEQQADEHYARATVEDRAPSAIAAHSARELARQIADGIVLTSMTASEEVRSRRESR